jgi:hypothetical protein
MIDQIVECDCCGADILVRGRIQDTLHFCKDCTVNRSEECDKIRITYGVSK